MGDAIAAHERVIRDFGGRAGVQDIGLAESAIGRAFSGYYRFAYQKAAALMHSLATNHAFVDGNKRTALSILHLFLDKSGYELRKTSTNPHEDDAEHLILDVTTRFLDFEEATTWLKKRVRRRR